MFKYGPPKLASFRYCRIILTGKCQGSCEKNRWAWNCQEIFSVPSTNSQQPRTRCSMSVHKMIPISLSTRNWPRVTIWLHVLAMEPLVDAPPGSSLAQNARGNFSFPKIFRKTNVWLHNACMISNRKEMYHLWHKIWKIMDCYLSRTLCNIG